MTTPRAPALSLPEWIEAMASGNGERADAPTLDDLHERSWAAEVHRDPEAFTPLFERYHARIVNYLYRRTMDADLAHELAARTFLAAFDHLRAASRDLLFRPWIYRIATNVHLTHCRSAGRMLRRLAELAHLAHGRSVPPTSRKLVAEDEAARARAALLNLPDRYRAPIILRLDEDLDYAEIAVALEIAQGTARSRVSRGLAMIRAELSRMERSQ